MIAQVWLRLWASQQISIDKVASSKVFSIIEGIELILILLNIRIPILALNSISSSKQVLKSVISRFFIDLWLNSISLLNLLLLRYSTIRLLLIVHHRLHHCHHLLHHSHLLLILTLGILHHLVHHLLHSCHLLLLINRLLTHLFLTILIVRLLLLILSTVLLGKLLLLRHRFLLVVLLYQRLVLLFLNYIMKRIIEPG